MQITSDNWIEIFDEDVPTSSSDRAMLWNDYLGTRGTQFSQGFKPKKTVEHAVKEIIEKFREGDVKDEERYYNLKWMQNTVFAGE